MCRKFTKPWSKLEATTRHSAMGSTSGPPTSTAAHAIRRREGGLSTAPSHAESRIVWLPERAGQETPLPAEQREWLPGVAALADG